MTTKAERKLRDQLAAAALFVAIARPGPVQDAWLATLREAPDGPSFPERLRALAEERAASAGP